MLTIPYCPFQFAALQIHRIVFEEFGDHNFDKRAAVCGYHTHILYSVDSHARRGRVTSHIQLFSPSNSQN